MEWFHCETRSTRILAGKEEYRSRGSIKASKDIVEICGEG